MKNLFLLAGIGLVAYAVLKNHRATVANNAAPAFDGGVAGTSGGGAQAWGVAASQMPATGPGGAFAPVGSTPQLGMQTDGMMRALPVSRDTPDAVGSCGGCGVEPHTFTAWM